MPAFPRLLIWIGLWSGANTACHVTGSNAACQGLLVEEEDFPRTTCQTWTSTTQISCRKVEKVGVEDIQHLHHPGTLDLFSFRVLCEH